MTQRPVCPESRESPEDFADPETPKLNSPSNHQVVPRGNRRIAELIYLLTTEGQAPRDQALAVGIGVFVGCIPLFGTHFLIVFVLASLTGLSRVRMYAATWISNPIFAPFLVWAELQVGHFVLTGRAMEHSVQQVRGLGAANLGGTAIVGAVLIGISLGILAATMAWAWIPRGAVATRRRNAIETTAHRYLDLGLSAWYHTRRVLYGNPTIVDLVTGGTLDSYERIVDLGCGQGELLALVLTATPTRSPGSCVGITSDPQWAARARQVLPAGVEVEVQDPTLRITGPADSVLVWVAQTRDAPTIDDGLLWNIHDALNPGALVVISWSTKRFFGHKSPAFNHVLHRAKAIGFSIENQLSSTALWRRQNMIVARV